MPDFNQMQRRRLAAKRQAMPDGGFPIRNVADLKNAIQAFGRAKNKPAVKSWIKKRARELGATNLLPENWRDDTLVHYGVIDEMEVNMWTYSYTYPNYICHHGIKGMKWGIRRTPAQLGHKASPKHRDAKGRQDYATNLLPDSWRDDTLVHYGIKGQKWGIRRFQKEDGTLTSRGKARANKKSGRDSRKSNNSSSNKKSNSSMKSKIDAGKKAAVNGLKKYGPVVAKTAAITALAAVGVPTAVLSVANYVAFGQTPLRTLGLDSDYDSKYASMRGVSLDPIEIED